MSKQGKLYDTENPDEMLRRAQDTAKRLRAMPKPISVPERVLERPPAEPGPAEPVPAEPGPAEPGPAEPGPAIAVEDSGGTLGSILGDILS